MQKYVYLFYSTYCDEYESIYESLEKGTVLVVTSDQYSKRFHAQKLYYSKDRAENAKEIILDESLAFQEILGFGGAFTDSAGYNINLMNDENIKRKIIEAYYGSKNLDYSIGRTNMGGCDFSIRFIF